jgi:hypothetical protein
MRVYPNPVTKGGVLTLETDMVQTHDGAALVYDLQGRIMETFTLNQGQRVLKIPVTFRQGAYILRVENKVQKFVVIR